MKTYRTLFSIIGVLLLLAGCTSAVTSPTRPAETPIPPTAEPPPTAAPKLPPDPTEIPTVEPIAAGLIAFVSERAGNGEIYVMAVPGGTDADGSDPRRLTRWGQWDGYPTWSPDGTQIAYYSYISSRDWVIKVIDVEGGEPRQLTDNGICDGAPFWSPAGTRIAYSSAADCSAVRREIYVIDPDGGNPRNLTQHDADDMSGSWSPDSRQIVFASDRDGDYELYVLDVAEAEQGSGSVRQLTDNDAGDMMPAWSPDGRQIAFVSDRDGNDEIYVMATDGSDVQRLTDHSAPDWFPEWSPDGRQLLFNSRRDASNLEIYVMDIDGGNVQRLTNSPGDDFNAVWQPVAVESPSPTPGAASSTWAYLYKGDPRVAAEGALRTDDGGYLLVGATNYTHNDTAREDVWLCQTDAAGEVLWQRTYGGEGFDRGKAVLPAGDGGYVILAETQSFGAGGRDLYLLKVDADGGEVWSRTFGGPGNERAGDIQATADDGFVVVGSTASYGAGAQDLFLARVDAQGRELWAHFYGGEYMEEGHAVHQTADGGFFILGELLYREGFYPEQNPELYLLRTDASGEELWSRVWEKPGAQGGHALLPTADGGYLIAGILIPPGQPNQADVLLLKVDGEGNLLWDRSIVDAGMFDYAVDVVESAGGNYVLAGMATRAGRGGVLLLEIDPEGNVLWQRFLLEGGGNKVAMQVLEAPDGSLVIAGMGGASVHSMDALLFKADKEGNLDAASPNEIDITR